MEGKTMKIYECRKDRVKDIISTIKEANKGKIIDIANCINLDGVGPVPKNKERRKKISELQERMITDKEFEKTFISVRIEFRMYMEPPDNYPPVVIIVITNRSIKDIDFIKPLAAKYEKLKGSEIHIISVNENNTNISNEDLNVMKGTFI